MRLFTGKSIIVLATFGLLGLMAALVWLSDTDVINAQSSSVFIVEGKVIVDGRPAPDGSSIIAYIDGRDVAESKIQGGTFVMAIPEQPNKSLEFKDIEFAGKGSDGRLFDFPQKAIWLPGGRTTIALQLLTGAKILDQRPVPVAAEPILPFVVRGKMIINGRVPADGTLIVAIVNGERMPRNGSLVDGRFNFPIPSNRRLHGGEIVEFEAVLNNGRRRDFHQTVIWQPGSTATVGLEIERFREEPKDPSSPFGIPGISIPQLPDGIDIGCVIGVLGRIPSSLDDMSPQESIRVAQECFSGGLAPDDSARLELERLQIESEKLRLEQELLFQKEQQRLETERLQQERKFQLEQQRLDTQQRNRELERIKREQALQEEQDRLNRDRLKTERERQVEQDRIDAERRRQDLDRLKADQEMQDEQQRLNQRRALEEQQRQDELEKARFESERARIERERKLDEDRARLEQDRLKRDDEQFRRESNLNRQGPGGQQPGALDPSQSPDGDKALLGPTRGFFTNTRVGGLGAANQFMDPTMLAVIGILITMAATLMQMVKGS